MSAARNSGLFGIREICRVGNWQLQSISAARSFVWRVEIGGVLLSFDNIRPCVHNRLKEKECC